MTNNQPDAVRADFMSMTPEELGEYVSSLGEKPYRAAQLFSWMAKGAELEEMTAAGAQRLSHRATTVKPIASPMASFAIVFPSTLQLFTSIINHQEPKTKN